MDRIIWKNRENARRNNVIAEKIIRHNTFLKIKIKYPFILLITFLRKNIKYAILDI